MSIVLSPRRYYEEHDDIDNARVVLNKATLVNFKVLPHSTPRIPGFLLHFFP